MSDKAGIVQDDELQKEFESSERRQSPRYAAAAAAGFGPPARVIRSYDREVVGQDASAPPSYSESADVAAMKHQRQLDLQQAAAYGGYGIIHSGQAHQQQFQQPAQRQIVRVIRLPADYQVVRVTSPSVWTTRRSIVATIIVVKVIAIIIFVIVYASLASQWHCRSLQLSAVVPELVFSSRSFSPSLPHPSKNCLAVPRPYNQISKFLTFNFVKKAYKTTFNFT